MKENYKRLKKELEKSMSKQIEVTSKCPICHQLWTRMEYDSIPIGVMGLSMCNECTKKNSDENGNLIVKIPSNVFWK